MRAALGFSTCRTGSAKRAEIISEWSGRQQGQRRLNASPKKTHKKLIPSTQDWYNCRFSRRRITKWPETNQGAYTQTTPPESQATQYAPPSQCWRRSATDGKRMIVFACVNGEQTCTNAKSRRNTSRCAYRRDRSMTGDLALRCRALRSDVCGMFYDGVGRGSASSRPRRGARHRRHCRCRGTAHKRTRLLMPALRRRRANSELTTPGNGSINRLGPPHHRHIENLNRPWGACIIGRPTARCLCSISKKDPPPRAA